jgi:hypothetical protein
VGNERIGLRLESRREQSATRGEHNAVLMVIAAGKDKKRLIIKYRIGRDACATKLYRRKQESIKPRGNDNWRGCLS